MSSLTATPYDDRGLDLVQTIAAEVPADLPYVRFHIAKLFVSALLLRLGLDVDQISRFFPGVDLGNLSLEYLAMVDGDRLVDWFLTALDRFEPEARNFLREAGITPSSSGISA